MSVSGGGGGVARKAGRPERDSAGSRIFNPFAIAMQHVSALVTPQLRRLASGDAR